MYVCNVCMVCMYVGTWQTKVGKARRKWQLLCRARLCFVVAIELNGKLLGYNNIDMDVCMYSYV